MTRTEHALSAALVLVLTVGAAVGLASARGTSESDVERPVRPQVRSIAVVRTDLSDARELEGTLGFAAARTISGTGEGMVTWLPSVGRTVRRGRALYRINDRPAVLFYGHTPVYRRLDVRGSVGRDVRVVADNLAALGYDIGEQPAAGSTVRQQPASTEPATPPVSAAAKDPAEATSRASEPVRSVKVEPGDGVLTASLIAAIKRWQPTAGFDPTGVLEVGDVVVTSGPVRVRQLQARRGDPASGGLITVTGTTKTVTVLVDVLDAGSIKPKQRVSVTLPDQSTIRGTVTAIRTNIRSTEDDPDGSGSAQIKVSVGVQQNQVPRSGDAVKVQVKFTAKARPKILAVPVGALLALREGGYAVQVSGGRLSPVETGLFAMGLVEISGDGIAEGTKVDTTS